VVAQYGLTTVAPFGGVMWIAKLIRRSLNDLDGDLERVRAKTLTATSTKGPNLGHEQVRVLNKHAGAESITSAARSER